MKTKDFKKTKGITLISLVVSIVVLLILAGVSIVTLTGENGILTQVQQASKKTNSESELEKVQLSIAGSFNDDGYLDLTMLLNNLQHEVPNPKTIEPKIENNQNTFPVLVKAKYGMYKIDENGKAEEASGVRLNYSIAKLVKDNDNTVSLVATLTDEMQGQTIVWELKGDNKDSLEFDSDTATGENMTIKLKSSGVTVGKAIVEAKAQSGKGEVGICMVTVIGSINDAIIGTKNVSTLASEGISTTTDNETVDLSIVNKNDVEDIEYSISTDSIETTMTGTRVSTSGIVTLGTFNDNTANSAKVTIILTGKTTEISKKIMITVTKPLPAKDVLPNPTNDATSPYVNYVDKNGNTILCRVLYNDSTQGLELISVSTVGSLTWEGRYDPIQTSVRNYLNGIMNNETTLSGRLINSSTDMSQLSKIGSPYCVNVPGESKSDRDLAFWTQINKEEYSGRLEKILCILSNGILWALGAKLVYVLRWQT